MEIPIVKMDKLRYREVKPLLRSPASEHWSWDHISPEMSLSVPRTL